MSPRVSEIPTLNYNWVISVFWDMWGGTITGIIFYLEKFCNLCSGLVVIFWHWQPPKKNFAGSLSRINRPNILFRVLSMSIYSTRFIN
jgi:hypothetical protein